MKKNYRLIFILSLIFTLFLTSCDFDFEDDVQEEISTEYTFFAYNPDSTANPANGSITYEIGTQLSAASMPSFLEGGVNTLKPGYLIDSWKYLKNPDTGKEYPAGIVLDSDGNVTSLTVQAARSYFYVSSWSPMTYYLHFDANGGYGSMSDMTMTYDTSYTLDANTFARNGFDFKGWGWNAGDTNVAFPDGVTGVTNLTRVTGGTVTLYAIWWKKNITISFDANGGSGTMAPIDAEVNVTTVPDCTFTAPTGHEFSHWTCDKTSYNYTKGETLYEDKWPNDDATFTAQWSPLSYTLTLNCNGGTINGYTSAEKTCYYNISTPILGSYYYNSDTSNGFSYTRPYRAGYEFKNWNTAADGSGTSYEYNDSIKLTANQTLYAQWKEESVTITYNSNGGEGSMASQTIKYTDLPTTLSNNNYIRSGYIFSGWGYNTTTVSFTNKASITNSNWFGSGSQTLYAIWTPWFKLGTASTTTLSVTQTSWAADKVVLSSDSDNCIWYIDDVQKATGKTFTINTSDYTSSGSHTIAVAYISISSGKVTIKQYENTFTITK